MYCLYIGAHCFTNKTVEMKQQNCYDILGKIFRLKNNEKILCINNDTNTLMALEKKNRTTEFVT